MTPNTFHKLFAIAVVIGVSVACTVSLFRWNQGWADVHNVLDAAVWFMKVFLFCAAAPTFICYRLLTAPLGSAVFLIAYITCAFSGFFIYPDLFGRSHDPSGVGTMVAFLFLWLGAFLCIIPKWSPNHSIKRDALKRAPYVKR